MKRSLLLAASLLLAMPSTAFAFTPEERSCYADIMEGGINKKYVIVASTVSRSCACIVNNQKQGLSPLSCPTWSYITNQQYDTYFTR